MEEEYEREREKVKEAVKAAGIEVGAAGGDRASGMRTV